MHVRADHMHKQTGRVTRTTCTSRLHADSRRRRLHELEVEMQARP